MSTPGTDTDSLLADGAGTTGPGLVRALGAHAGRFLTIWARQPGTWVTAFAVPLFYLYITKELFGGFIRTLTGALDINHITLVVAVSWAFVLALSGSGAVLAERRSGLHDRFETLPLGHGRAVRGVVLHARVLAEFVLCALMMLLVESVAALTTDFTLWTDSPGTLVLVTVLVSAAAASVGVAISAIMTSPQGQIGVIPVIVVFMFINTGILPGDHFRPALQGFAEHTPVSAVISLVDASSAGEGTAGRWALALGWFVGLFVLGQAGIMTANRRRNR